MIPLCCARLSALVELCTFGSIVDIRFVMNSSAVLLITSLRDLLSALVETRGSLAVDLNVLNIVLGHL